MLYGDFLTLQGRFSILHPKAHKKPMSKCKDVERVVPGVRSGRTGRFWNAQSMGHLDLYELTAGLIIFLPWATLTTGIIKMTGDMYLPTLVPD